MKIRILSNADYLDLPKGFKLSVELYNPFFSEMGSTSLPIDLPRTANNIRQLFLGAGMQRHYSVQKNIRCLIEAGGYRKTGTINILGLSSKSVSINILLDESTFYTKVQADLMPDIFTKKVAIPHTQRTEQTLATPIYNTFSLYFDCDGAPEQNDFLMFPMRIGVESTDEDTQLFINRTEVNSPQGIGIYGYFPFYAEVARSYTIDGNEVSAPVGFGLSPQLRIGYVLKTVFAHYGYILTNNIFQTDNVLKWACVANNNVDTLIASQKALNENKAYWYYSHLVPTCSVAEWLDAVRKAFSIDFIMKDGSVAIKTVGDIFSSTKLVNLTHKLTEPVSYTISTPTRMVFKAHIENAENIYLPYLTADMVVIDGQLQLGSSTKHLDKQFTPCKTYDEMISQFRSIFDTERRTFNSYYTIEALAQFAAPIGFVREYGCYYYSPEAASLTASEMTTAQTFHYYPIAWGSCESSSPTDAETQEINLGNQMLNIRGFLTMPSYRLVKSMVKVGEDGDTSKADNGLPNLDIYFAFAYNPYVERKTQQRGTITQKTGVDATMCAYAMTNNGPVGYSLLPTGPRAAETLNSAHNNMLLSSMHTAAVLPHLTPSEVSNIDMTSKYLIENVPMLCKSLKYEIDESDNVTVADSEFLTVNILSFSAGE